MKIFLVFMTIFFLFPFSVKAFSFTETLKVGSAGQEVLELQKFLNRDPETVVAISGPGSIGEETSRFGALTKIAVGKFQNKYRADVLEPAGLLSPTGIVGPLTRKKLNSISVSPIVVSAPPIQSIFKPTPIAKPVIEILSNNVQPSEIIDIYQTDKKISDYQNNIVNEINSAIEGRRIPNISLITESTLSFSPVFISRFSSQQSAVGTQITIMGGGFSSTNSVYFGKDYVVRGVQSSGDSLIFSVPKIPTGRYDLVVKSGSSVSNSLYFVVKGDKDIPVSITSVSPSVLNYSATVTIAGSGFTPTGNEIVTTFATIKDVPSADGKTLSFVFRPESFRALNSYGNQNSEVPVTFFVINDNGFFDFQTPSNFKY